MFRITTHTQEGRTAVAIAGLMADDDAKELRRVRKSMAGVAVSLNLRGLDACAPECIRVLREWLAEGAQLEEASPFLSMVLKEPPRRNAPASDS